MGNQFDSRAGRSGIIGQRPAIEMQRQVWLEASPEPNPLSGSQQRRGRHSLGYRCDQVVGA